MQKDGRKRVLTRSGIDGLEVSPPLWSPRTGPASESKNPGETVILLGAWLQQSLQPVKVAQTLKRTAQHLGRAYVIRPLR